jgi:nicotinamide-nucleotide amidase
MIVEVVSIGDEILKGSIVNTNSAFISHELLKAGIKVTRQTALSDEPSLLREGLQECFERSDLIITTGGLGPTLDDITREVVADLFGCDFYFNEEVAKDLKRRYGDHLISLENQATVPKGALILKNQVGTAPGLIFTSEYKTMILLPGVPREMEAMVINEVLPYLKKKAFKQVVYHAHTSYFSILPESAIDPVLRQIRSDFPNLEIGIYPSHGVVAVSFLSNEKESLQHAVDKLESSFKLYLFPSKSGRIEEAVHEWMIQNKKTLAFAESCTGGALSSAITAIPGASDYFLGSLVTYSNSLKETVLSVPPAILEQYGAVSGETVHAMWEGLIKMTGADFGIAVSGIAGPSGGTKEKPVGTVWAAIGPKDRPPEIGSFVAFGNRKMVISSTANKLFGSFYRKLSHGIPCFPFLIP